MLWQVRTAASNSASTTQACSLPNPARTCFCPDRRLPGTALAPHPSTRAPTFSLVPPQRMSSAASACTPSAWHASSTQAAPLHSSPCGGHGCGALSTPCNAGAWCAFALLLAGYKPAYAHPSLSLANKPNGRFPPAPSLLAPGGQSQGVQTLPPCLARWPPWPAPAPACAQCAQCPACCSAL